ncbi:MAG TPA: hypothetical protein VN654_31625 [Vicinamibacterales bacterium]|nr:hypothetical protein [Vicinamibacterales bacterium]
MRKTASILGLVALVVVLFSLGLHVQAQQQALDEGGAPVFKVDPFWPKWLPNKWGMQQVTGIGIDPSNDHVWFLNRAAAANPDETGGANGRLDCCIQGPELIELDQEGNVVHAWGEKGKTEKWPTALQTVIVDSKGFVWVAGTGAQDSILKYTKEGKLVWDFGHRPPADAKDFKETNQMTDAFVSKGRFQLDETTNEIYIINQRRVLVYDMNTGAFKRGWGGHGMALSEITNDPLPKYKWTGGPPTEEKNLVPDLHFVEISKDRKVYVGERGQNRIEVFTTDGKFLQEFYVSPNTPSQRAEDCGGLYHPKLPPCGTTYKLALSRDPQQKYMYVADGTNDKVWILDRRSGGTLGSFGRNGTYAGQFHWINAIAMDSKGNLYTGEVEENKRIQKFVPQSR